jgi:hypothetical protein
MQLDLTPDFYVLDILEPVTLRVTGQPDVAIPAALSRPANWKEADPSAGNVVRGDRIWAWPVIAAPVQSPLGAVIVDSGNVQWTILAVVKKTHAGIWEYHARDLTIVNNLDDLATVLKASYAKSPGGEAVATWTTQLTNVPARFQVFQQEAKILEDAEWPQTTYHVLLGTDIFAPEIPVEPASADYRLVDARGRHYRIVKYQRPERIDALPIADCVLVLEGSEGGATDRLSSSGA